MKKTVVYMVILVVISLVAGALLGTVVARKQSHRKQERIFGKSAQRQELKHKVAGALERLSQALDLSADQKVKLAEILKASRQEVMGIKEKTKEALMEVKNRTDVKIREILTPEQQVKFDQIESKFQKKIGEKIAQRQEQKK